MMKQFVKIMAAVMLAVSLAGCSASAPQTGGDEELPAEEEQQPEKEKELVLRIGDTKVDVTWEDNESVTALKEKAAEGPLTVKMTLYGGFEQVGALGFTLPSNDTAMDTVAGDIVLYTGNMLVIFYGTNSWNYTGLGHVENKTVQDMEDLLTAGDVVLTLTME